MLKKYITYAKLNKFPRLHDTDLNKVTEVYTELHRESSVRFTYPFFMTSTTVFYSDSFKKMDIMLLFILVMVFVAWTRGCNSGEAYRVDDKDVRGTCKNASKTSCETG